MMNVEQGEWYAYLHNSEHVMQSVHGSNNEPKVPQRIGTREMIKSVDEVGAYVGRQVQVYRLGAEGTGSDIVDQLVRVLLQADFGGRRRVSAHR